MNRKRVLTKETLAVWGGEERLFMNGATQVPVVHSVSFGYEDMDQWLAAALDRNKGHIYSRNTNPTVAVFEEKVRLLEDGEAATSAATGMGIISCCLHAMLRAGKRVVSVKDTYGGTSKIFMEFLPGYGVDVELCDTTDAKGIERAIAKGCDVLYLETPTNPTLKLLDLERLSAAGHKKGAVVMVDNTFATPINQSPLKLGADIVLHSATKFLGGHADALGGVAVGSRKLIDAIYHYREINGASLHPMSAYLLLRGMKTLHLRVERQAQNAQRIAEFLAGHPKVTVVNYPGLRSHPQYKLACRQMRGFGSMLSFAVKGDFKAVGRVLPRLRLARAAANLGAVETLVGPPAVTSHVECSAKERAKLGIPEGLIRYSAGIENADDLIADLKQAMKAI